MKCCFHEPNYGLHVAETTKIQMTQVNLLQDASNKAKAAAICSLFISEKYSYCC